MLFHKKKNANKQSKPRKIPPKWVGQARHYTTQEAKPAPTKIPAASKPTLPRTPTNMRQLLKDLEELQLIADDLGMDKTRHAIKMAAINAVEEIKDTL